ncbi:MAG TPA: DUF885 domain-containing protein [Trebonia sp.]|jgi:uncharacterized protein (DUF885 family)
MNSDQRQSPIFRLADDYLTQQAALDPVGAGMRGLSGVFGAATDYSPDGYEAQAELIARTLTALSALPVAGEADRIAALLLRERLSSAAAWHEAGEPLRELRTPIGRIAALRDSVDLLPRSSEEDWRNIGARLAAIPAMFGSWRDSLAEGLRRGLPAARRQALGAAGQAETYARIRTHDALISSYGDGPLASSLASAAAAAYAGYDSLARYLREEYAPGAVPADAVGAERYAVNARLSLGADLDPREAYEWGWAELGRIEAEMKAEAGSVRAGASVAEAWAILGETEFVDGEDAYAAWLQERHDEAVSRLNGTAFDIPPALQRIDAVLARGSASGAAYYTAPSEDLTRPGRTWWPLGGRQRFSTWNELTVVFHEGVPGHHLQAGAATVSSSLSRFARNTFISGHGEGWALYAERLADELGWFADYRGSRLGMLAGSATRAARVVIDIGVHLDLPLPDGSRWTFASACDVLRDRGHIEEYRVVPEVTRYFGWPGQAPSYKLGERAWLAARSAAAAKPGFDLKKWHAAALRLGPLGLDSLTSELSGIAG